MKEAEKKANENGTPENAPKKRKVAPKKKDEAKTAALTLKLLRKLSTYYGLAIIRNKDSLENMRNEIWATFYHYISTDKKPQHERCPKGADSWCAYQKAQATNSLEKFKHPPALSEEAQTILKPIYEDLSKDDLLKRCLGGNTQNNNESFNMCVWSIAPKHLFCGHETVEIATHLAACIFNEGFATILKVMEIMEIKIGRTALIYAEKRDDKRVRTADRRSSEIFKRARKSRREEISQEIEQMDEAEGVLYGPGIAD